MRTNCIQFLALACLLLLLPSPCLTQHLPARLETLEIEQLIKIRTVSHGLHIGRLTRISDDTLFLRPQRGSNAVGTAAIDQLWVRGTAAKKGAVIGGLVGAATGALLGAIGRQWHRRYP